MAQYKVLIADDERQTSSRLASFLRDKGFEVVLCHSGKEAKELVNSLQPHFCLIDLMLPEVNGIQFAKFVKQHAGLADTKVLITSGHNSVVNVKEALTAGAADYIIKPFKFEDLMARLIFHIQKKRKVEDLEEVKGVVTPGDKYLQLLEFVFREANSPRKYEDVAYNLVKMLALTLQAVRCSVIECGEDRLTGFVQASSDDKKARGIKLDLNRYPEVVHVLNTEKIVVIENIEDDPVMAEIKKNFKNVMFNAIVVAPVRRKGKFYGVISCRMPKEKSTFHDRDIRFVMLLSHVFSMVISASEDPTIATPLPPPEPAVDPAKAS